MGRDEKQEAVYERCGSQTRLLVLTAVDDDDKMLGTLRSPQSSHI